MNADRPCRTPDRREAPARRVADQRLRLVRVVRFASLAQCLRAIDDEQAADLRVQTPLDQGVQQGLHRPGVLRRALRHAERALPTVSGDPDRRRQHQVLKSMPPSAPSSGPPTAPRTGATPAASRCRRRVTPECPLRQPHPRPKRRVGTLISIRFSAQRPSRSSDCAPPGRGAPVPSHRGRAPAVGPATGAAVKADLAPRLAPRLAPAMASLAVVVAVARAAQRDRVLVHHPAQRAQAGGQAEPLEACSDPLGQASATATSRVSLDVSLLLSMALLSCCGGDTPSLPAQGEQRRQKVSTGAGTSPPSPPLSDDPTLRMAALPS